MGAARDVLYLAAEISVATAKQERSRWRTITHADRFRNVLFLSEIAPKRLSSNNEEAAGAQRHQSFDAGRAPNLLRLLCAATVFAVSRASFQLFRQQATSRCRAADVNASLTLYTGGRLGV